MYTDQNCENAISKPNQPAKVRATHPEGLEEPLVLARLVAVLEQLFDVLLRVLPLCRLLEGVRRDGALQALELESVAGREEVGVVEDLDEGLDLAPARQLLLAHPSCDLEGGVNKGVEVG